MRLWTRLVIAFTVVVLLLGGTTIYTGSRLIARTVLREAQYRTQLDLRSARAQIDTRLREVEATLEHAARTAAAQEAVRGGASESARIELERLRLHEGLDVLSACDARGDVALRTRHPYKPGGSRALDPVVEQALAGRPGHGIVVLHADELAAEGGELPRQAFVRFVETPRAKPRPETSQAAGMVLWAAAPVVGQDGTVLGALYGGVLLNRNWAIVDGIGDSVFGDRTYEGKRLGTVTIFQWDVRVATNVTDDKGNRAIGTRVSEEVYDRVLENGRTWYERAFVVNDWYLSSYEPIVGPREKVIGILYVGILERKYTDQRNAILRSFLTPAGLAIVVSIALSLVLAHTIAHPLGELVVASRRLADGDFGYRPRPSRPSREVRALVEAFDHMAEAIQVRDDQLRQRNLDLEQSNAQLTQLNRDYMEMLGFVTHELKSPLASMIFNASALRDGYFGPLDGEQRDCIEAIVDNAQYLSEMILNYLNLARIEKGELALDCRPFDLRADILEPVLAQCKPQLDDAAMEVELQAPDRLELVADPALVRIVVDNLVSNAVKYGRQGGRIVIEADEADGALRLSVWNEGEGIGPDDLPKLFGKFVRLNHPAAKAHGSGLGLFVSREIVERHGGRIWAESEPGQWARFTLTIPTQTPQTPEAHTD